MKKFTPINSKLCFARIVPFVFGIVLSLLFSLSVFAADSGKDTSNPTVDISSTSKICFEHKLSIFDRISGFVRSFGKKVDNNSDLMNICNIKLKLTPFI